MEISTDYLLSLEENANLNEVLGAHGKSKASKLSHIVAAEENAVLVGILHDIEEQTRLKPICLLFDGAIIEATDEEEKSTLRSCIQNCMDKFNVNLKIEW